MNNTAVLWIRVSSPGQESGFSLDSQERLVGEAVPKELIIKNTFRVTESAKISEARRRFQEMVEFVKANNVGHLFAWSHDRLARHHKDFSTLQSLVDDNDIAIHLVESNKIISRESPITDRFMFQVLAALAEADNRKRGADTRRGMEEKARHGEVPNKAPVGYLNIVDPEDKHPDPTRRRKIVVLDPERAPLITGAFEAFAKGGWSLSTMAEELNHRGLTTRTTEHRLSKPLTFNSLHKVLINPFYYGKFIHSKNYYQGTYAPLVTKDVWLQVQARLGENRTYSRPATKKQFAFKSFLKCGYCGSGISAFEASWRKGKGKYVYYVCSESQHRHDPDWYMKKFGTKHCKLKSWREEKINALIEAEIGKLYVDKFLVEQVRERLKKINIEEDSFDRRELRRLEAERTRKKNHLKIMYQDRLDEKITIKQYEEVQAETQADLDRIHAEIGKLSHRNFKYKEQGSQVLELLHGIKDVYARADLPGKRKLLETMLSYVILKPDEEHFVVWQYPFSALFNLGEVFRKKLNRDPL